MYVCNIYRIRYLKVCLIGLTFLHRKHLYIRMYIRTYVCMNLKRYVCVCMYAAGMHYPSKRTIDRALHSRRHRKGSAACRYLFPAAPRQPPHHHCPQDSVRMNGWREWVSWFETSQCYYFRQIDEQSRRGWRSQCGSYCSETPMEKILHEFLHLQIHTYIHKYIHTKILF